MFCDVPKENGATPDEIPNPAQSKPIEVITTPPLVRFVIVMLLLPDTLPRYVFANVSELGVDEMSVVCAKAVVAPNAATKKATSMKVGRVDVCIIQPPSKNTSTAIAHSGKTAAVHAVLFVL